MIEQKIIQVPRHARAATVQSNSYNETENTIDVVWTTGADVLRCDPFDGSTYIERLGTDSSNVRLDRLNSGAAFLDTHNDYQLSSVLGSVVSGSARMDSGQGLATIKLSKSDRSADVVQDIKDGIIRNISVGYAVHAFQRIEGKAGSPAVMIATDWEPVEISAVPVPADPGAHIRSLSRNAAGLELNNCTISEDVSSKTNKEAILADENHSTRAAIELNVGAPAVSEVTKTDIEHAAAIHALETEQVVAVGADHIVTKGNHEITEPGDAHGTVKLSAADLKRQLDEAAARGAETERTRITEINKLARSYKGLSDLAHEHCRSGASVADFKDAILSALAERSANAGDISTSISEPSLAPKATDWSYVRKYVADNKKEGFSK